MTNPTQSATQSTAQSATQSDRQSETQSSTQNNFGPRARYAGRGVAIIVVALLLVALGGYWANQSGLLGPWLAPLTETTLSVAGGVEAQADQPVEAGAAGDQHVDTTQALAATAAMTSTVPFGPGGSGQPPVGSLPTGVDGSTGRSREASSTTATAEEASASATGTDSTASGSAANLLTIPAVAGVKGSQLLSAGGELLATLDSGAGVLANGRSADSTWLSVTATGGDGWVAAAQLIAYGLYRLPVVEAPAAVVATSGPPLVLSTASGNEGSAPAIPATGTGTAATELATPEGAGEQGASTTAVAGEGAQAAAATQSENALRLEAVVNTDTGRLNIRSGPGTDYAIVAKGADGSTYVAVGRNEAGDWLQIELDDGEVGWAAAAYLKLDGGAVQLPLRLVPEASAQASEKEPAATVAAGSTSGVLAVTDTVANIGTGNTASSTLAAGGGLEGTLVFQQSRGGMIYAYDLSTGGLWPLTNGFDPSISPDGSTVAFVRDGGEMGLYLIDIDGSNERRIFERAVLSSPKWSTDGQWIVFSRNDEGVECYQVMPNYCMLPDEALDRFPMGVPSDIPLVTEYQHKLSAVDSNGDNFHDIKALNSARAVDWSDAGIVYQSSAGIQITGDGEQALNQEVIYDNLNPNYADPDLQPLGGQIVFQIKGAAQTDLWVVNTDGTGKMALTQPKTTLVDSLPSNVAAAYSPDGQHIVFLSNRTAANDAGDWRLWVMNADGSDQRQLPIDVAIDYTYGLEQVVSWGL